MKWETDVAAADAAVEKCSCEFGQLLLPRMLMLMLERSFPSISQVKSESESERKVRITLFNRGFIENKVYVCVCVCVLYELCE